MSGDRPKRTPEEEAAIEERMTGAGIASIGDEVIWDGEAEQGGYDPLVWYPEQHPDDTKPDDTKPEDAKPEDGAETA
jgi:hypothetical protein